MKGELPILEHLHLETSIKDSRLKLPQIFQAPNLRHLHLSCVALPMQAPLLMNIWDLVFLLLEGPPRICLLFSKSYAHIAFTDPPAREALD
jgi:hypothetical protein